MATPSSSATTPSPRPRYLQSPGGASSSTIASNGLPSNDNDERERLAKKITAGAHIGELALSLRARLLYANFKVRSNTTSHTLNELDSQLPPAGKHTPNGKRTANFFHDPGSPTGNAMSAGQSRSGARKGSMAPPPAVTASAAQSLFSSILAPPAAKRARTIHNPEDPPVPAPEKLVEQTRSPHRSSKATRTPDARTKSKSHKAARDKAGAPSSGRGKGKGKQRITAEGSFEQPAVEDREIDMEAAATLTTLLLNQTRPSVSVGSPRSSISAGSDSGSTHSFAHYAQSATRTASGGTPGPPSQQSLFARTTSTPPHSPAMSQASPALSHATARRSSITQGSSLRQEGAGTPKMTPRDRVDDTDAADMLLLMATSPSPARPSTTRDRDARDAAAYRALRGGGSGLKGRVLFPTYGGGEDSGGGGTPRMLSREMSGSFASMSSTMTEPVSPRTIPSTASHAPSRLSTVQDASQGGDHGYLDVPMLPTVTPPTPTDQAPSQLLSPVLPSSQHTSSRPATQSVEAQASSSTVG
ncbi:hypothetical protein L226DRAFT_571154 [Lentinus tigrinus ALCF2SS1-7]|uniref:Uncharacterized protein n=1 Tax=Lentinus tigrinus ALCF2SS1-6 TaxID=1328759 RepID=A0A5C2S8Q2_9APHY|nr:hypothetical protein L227DRAFT_611560 [Lentinus tigrinus ALCF2SS1-6]RPD74888.1 hypothetical protein L226DRAFT_571154 [Lentinus tigrinus ALCF2SS1-7]